MQSLGLFCCSIIIIKYLQTATDWTLNNLIAIRAHLHPVICHTSFRIYITLELTTTGSSRQGECGDQRTCLGHCHPMTWIKRWATPWKAKFHSWLTQLFIKVQTTFPKTSLIRRNALRSWKTKKLIEISRHLFKGKIIPSRIDYQAYDFEQNNNYSFVHLVRFHWQRRCFNTH